jgi:predicted AAA+ superfamily ATPase
VFETFVVSELLKACHHRGEEPDLWFWRDSSGHEMDVLVDRGVDQVPVEAKSGQTIAADFFDALRYWRRLVEDDQAPGVLVYGGDRSFVREGFQIYSWADL